MSDENVGGLVELTTPSAWAIREGIGEGLWHFSSTQKAAQSMVGYKDSVEPLFTAEQMHAYARAALSAHGQPVVDENAINRVMDAQPFASENDARRVWQLFKDDVHVADAIRGIVAALTGANP